MKPVSVSCLSSSREEENREEDVEVKPGVILYKINNDNIDRFLAYKENLTEGQWVAIPDTIVPV